MLPALLMQSLVNIGHYRHDLIRDYCKKLTRWKFIDLLCFVVKMLPWNFTKVVPLIDESLYTAPIVIIGKKALQLRSFENFTTEWHLSIIKQDQDVSNA